MKVAIVYDSRTGNTKAAVEEMVEIVRAAGHECSAHSVREADPAKVAAADAVCIGSWANGLFIIFQHATRDTMDFIDRLGSLDGKPAAVFCTYKVSPGKMLSKMADRLSARGANVTGQFRSRGPMASKAFREWVHGLGTENN